MTAPRPVLALWLVAVVCSGLHLVAPTGAAGALSYLVVMASAAVVAGWGARGAPPGHRLVPLLATGGLAATFVAETIYQAYDLRGGAPDVSVADAFYYLGYVGLGAAVLVVVVRDHHDRTKVDVEAVIDALTVVVVSVLLFWTTSVREIVQDGSTSLGDRAVLAGYPVVDAILIALVARALVVPARRAALGVPFAVGMACWLFADIGFLVSSAEGLVRWLDAAWMIGTALMAAAPWARPTPAPEVDAPERDAWAPLAGLALAVLPLAVPPLMLLLDDVLGGTVLVLEAAVGMLLLVTLVFWRTARVLLSEHRLLAELAVARDDALAASRAKSEFLATMSHEIRTPMNGVIGLNELMLTTSLDARQQQYAEGVRGAGQALLGVINEILDFSKIEAGGLRLEEIDFDLTELVEGVAEIVAEPAHAKSLELLAYCSPELPTGVRGDPVRVRQVLLNLAGNAVKFTGAGEVIVRATLDGRDGDRLAVRFEVTDTGIGLAEADRERLFEPFSQADSSTTRQYGGTGLGLAICRRLVAAMDGELGVESTPGEGSTFWFTLPLGVAAEPPPDPAAADLAGLRVIVVDDNQTNRDILGGQLSHWGMTVDVVDGAAAALERMAEADAAGRPFQLGVLDLCMPETNGLALARQIAADPRFAATRLVLMTSGPDVTQTEAREASIAVALTKPVLMSRLRSTLEQVAAQVAAQVGAAQPATESAPAEATSDAPVRGHLLLVEDGEINQLVAVGILSHLGYSVEVAEDGHAGVRAATDGRFDAILMDVQMPGMDGYEATGRIRELEGETRRTPIIAMTAGASDGERARCLASGMDDFLSKPVQKQDVADMLDQWVPVT